MSILITGIAPYSLGECIVEDAPAELVNRIIAVDLHHNEWLRNKCSYQSLEVNLNPAERLGQQDGLSTHLEKLLHRSLDSMDDSHISCVIQSAGVYWSGPFEETGEEQRRRLVGVNMWGRIEVLHAAMRVNTARGADNSNTLVSIDIGSFQGLNIRPKRAIYAPSKSFGVDFSFGLVAGNEVLRSIYFAPGPIDTHMLHYNHWVVKAGAPREFLTELLRDDRATYQAILVDCSDEAFVKFVKDKASLGVRESHFEDYKQHRQEVVSGYQGLLAPQDCAKRVWQMVNSPSQFASGVYLTRSSAVGGLVFKGFDELSRHRAFGL